MRFPTIAIFVFVGIAAYSPSSQIINSKQVEASSGIAIELSTDKKTYSLGEVVNFRAKFINKTSRSVSINPDTQKMIKIAYSVNSDFKNYFPPSLSFVDDGVWFVPPILPNKELVWDGRILWNRKTDLSDLDGPIAVSYKTANISSDYALPLPGQFFLKATANIQIDGKSKTFESAPVEISVRAPEAADVTIWEVIKLDSGIGYFIQTSEYPYGISRDVDRQNQFVDKLQSLIDRNPAGIYATPLAMALKSNLEKNYSGSRPMGVAFSENMSVGLMSKKKEYLRSEPIALKCSFSNKTVRQQNSILPDFSSEGMITVSSNGIERSYRMDSRSVPRRPMRFEPKSGFEEDILLDTDLDIMFPSTGTFSIYFSLPTYRGYTLKSNPVQIKINEPAGRDKEALDFFTRHKAFLETRQLFGWFRHVKLDGRQTILEQFVNDYPDTVYGDLAALRLGTYFRERSDTHRASVLFERASRSDNLRIANDAKFFLRQHSVVQGF